MSPVEKLKRGDTYLDVGTYTDVLHLWVICSDPCPQTGEVVVVSVTEHKSDRQDQTCGLDDGDHPFIKKSSIVYYRVARRRRLVDLERLLRSGRIKRRAMCNDDTLGRVVSGFADSMHAPPECVELLEAQGYI